MTQYLDTLLAKEAAGANLAITQLFFEAHDYLRFVNQARSAGVTMRILPGHHAYLDADADVTSIEAARSKMEVVPDIIETALASIPNRQVWINPDCGARHA